MRFYSSFIFIIMSFFSYSYAQFESFEKIRWDYGIPYIHAQYVLKKNNKIIHSHPNCFEKISLSFPVLFLALASMMSSNSYNPHASFLDKNLAFFFNFLFLAGFNISIKRANDIQKTEDL